MAWIRDNWDRVLNSVIALFGVGGIVMFFTDFMEMCRERPWQAVFLAALCLAIGYCAGWKVFELRAYDTDRFTPRQMHIIFDCYRASFNRRGYLALDHDNNEVVSLLDEGVVSSSDKASLPIGENGKRKQAVRLTPSWYRYVKRHERKFKRLYEKSEKMVDWKTA